MWFSHGHRKHRQQVHYEKFTRRHSTMPGSSDLDFDLELGHRPCRFHSKWRTVILLTLYVLQTCLCDVPPTLVPSRAQDTLVPWDTGQSSDRVRTLDTVQIQGKDSDFEHVALEHGQGRLESRVSGKALGSIGVREDLQLQGNIDAKDQDSVELEPRDTDHTQDNIASGQRHYSQGIIEPTVSVHNQDGKEPSKSSPSQDGMEPTKSFDTLARLEPTKSSHTLARIEPTKTQHTLGRIEATKSSNVLDMTEPSDSQRHHGRGSLQGKTEHLKRSQGRLQPWDSRELVMGELKPHPDEDLREIRLEETAPQPGPYMLVQPHSVPLQYFAKKLQEAKTFHDVYRIFYGEFLTDDVIESLLTSQSQSQYYQGAVGRPRIGGLSDPISYGVHRPSIQELRRTLDHVHDMAKRTQCHTPVPVLVRARDHVRAPHLEFFPTCTVVYRCSEQSGCCAENEKCVPKSENTITAFFYVVSVVPATQSHLGPNVVHGTPFVQTLNFTNHTECMCMPKPKMPECLSCPHPVFTLTRHADMSCMCDCNMKTSSVCKRIKRGFHHLDQQQLRCIKAGQCYKPPCRWGEFNVRNGFCPVSPKYGKNSGRHKPQRTSSEDVHSGSPDNSHQEQLELSEEEMKLRRTNLSGKR